MIGQIEEPVKPALVAPDGDRNTRGTKAASELLTFFAQWIHSCGDDVRRRQASHIAEDRRGQYIRSVTIASEILLGEPLHVCRGEHSAGGVRACRRRLASLVDNRVDQHLERNRRSTAIAGEHGRHRSQVAAGAVAGNDKPGWVAAELRDVVGNPFGGHPGVVHRSRKRKLRAKLIVDRNHHRACAVGQSAAA